MPFFCSHDFYLFFHDCRLLQIIPHFLHHFAHQQYVSRKFLPSPNVESICRFCSAVTSAIMAYNHFSEVDAMAFVFNKNQSSFGYRFVCWINSKLLFHTDDLGKISPIFVRMLQQESIVMVGSQWTDAYAQWRAKDHHTVPMDVHF